jgi:anti-sigma regulatory factor (Ser/Thr protein kinase)
LIEPERSVAALGFVERRYADDGQTVWLTAEIESKSEALRDVAEFWCDRLEMASISCGFDNFQLWLIAPEGFSPEALDLLAARGAYGSSRTQVEYLRDFLNAGELVQQPAGREYEMVIPVGDDTELIAAHAVEEIARRHNFPPRAINQIKTALVEACINAAEHGLSPDGKIYQHFIVDDEKIVVTISNRGISLADTPVAAPRGGRSMSAAVGDPFQVPASGTAVTVPEGRRGWGLKLIRGLMDDVKIEAVDDGTRISMTKYLKSESRAA